MNKQVGRVCNPAQVALNIAVGSATIANAVTSQCSTPVVTVPSSGGSSVIRVPRRPLPVVLPQQPQASRPAGVQTQSAGSLSYNLPPVQQPQAPVIIRPAEKQVNLNVRVINPDKKKECEVYVLREITERVVSTPQSLIKELQRQFGPQLVPTTYHFPVGYMKGSTKVSIRTPADVADIWTHLNRGDQIVLWCEGVRRKTSHSAELSDSESDEETSKKRKRSKKRKLSALDEKNNRVEDLVCTLREKHGDHYTTIQYRLWVEMVDIGTHRLEFDLRVLCFSSTMSCPLYRCKFWYTTIIYCMRLHIKMLYSK